MADPAAHDTEFGWRTRFWSLAYSTEVGPLVVLAQGMVGSTIIAPTPAKSSTTDFYAAYILLGWERQDWRYALRFDSFGTIEHVAPPVAPNTEHGFAVTAAITWAPTKHIRVIGEVLEVDSWRAERLDFGKSPLALETQVQLALRNLILKRSGPACARSPS